MDVIRLPGQLDEAPSPSALDNVSYPLLHGCNHLPCQNTASILGNKNQMVLQLINAVIQPLEVLRCHVEPSMLQIMPSVKRRITYRMYPSPVQQERMAEYKRLHAEIYNAAIQERRDAWRKQRISITKADQEKQLPAIKADRPEFKQLGGHALQETLRRVDLAFQAFFRRVKKGETPGFPRFKSWRRFKGWTYKSSSNWEFSPGHGSKHGTIELSGIGTIRLRGKPRQLGTTKTLTVTQKQGRWYASIVVEFMPERSSGREGIGFDWGIKSFLTLDTGEIIENPRFLEQGAAKLRQLERAASRKKRGSCRWRKAKARVARERERIANRRSNFLHQQSSRLVGRSALLSTETLTVKNMTASARGTSDHPGKNVRQKSGLNRNILDTAPASFLSMVRYKAEEAGIVLVEVQARKAKPSQTCPWCGVQRKKKLSNRRHRCPCGCDMDRDRAAAMVCLNHALYGVGNQPCVESGIGLSMNRETATECASAHFGGR
jgi:putative transposase